MGLLLAGPLFVLFDAYFENPYKAKMSHPFRGGSQSVFCFIDPTPLSNGDSPACIHSLFAYVA